jgi:hypothetical protein
VFTTLKANSRKKRVNARIREIKRLAAGADFQQWLASNRGRDDVIGDLADDLRVRPNDVAGAKRYEDVLQRIKRAGARPEAIEALADAWLEYSERYPDRLVRTAWCSICDDVIEAPSDGLLVWDDEFRVIHAACLSQPPKASLLLAKLTTPSGLETLEQFAETHEISESEAAEVEKLLRVWGLVAVHVRGTVYFVQSGTDGPIKIGFTTRAIEQRLANLQTAHAEKLRLLAQITGDRELERELHRRFVLHRMNGEWFEPHPDVIAFIADVTKR